MDFQKLLLLITLTVCMNSYWWHAAESACNVCQKNGAACVNLTSFHLCFGGTEPQTKQLFTCSNGLVCSDWENICSQRTDTQPASCGDTSSCGVCNANFVFACTSRTTFALCLGSTQPSNIVGNCPVGKICDASTQDICRSEEQPNSIICDA